MKRVMVVYGTRPEAIKLAPLISALRSSAVVEPVVAVTGQHRELLHQVHALFGITPDHDLTILTEGQTLTDITQRALTGLTPVIRHVEPDAVVVQGDTTTCFAGALAAFYAQVPVVHVEAGLRTHDRYAPFPEEMNRRLTTQLTHLHLAPTATNRAHLLSAGVGEDSVVVTGNTVIDALIEIAGRQLPYADRKVAEVVASGRRVIVVTAHRRESWGAPLRSAAGAVADTARTHRDIEIVVPLHPNPAVRRVVEDELAGRPNVHLVEPLPYADFARLLRDCHLVLTDSGGIQEEAPSLGRPVLVLRDTTERVEAVEAGTVRLVGTDRGTVHTALTQLLDDDRAYEAMASARNPYGDGKAAARSAAAIEDLLGAGIRLPDFGG
ncbi:UDP-N-acetylglucosamine 2-epimerase (non-hydrolyzing) [Actinopolymorpha sp. B9G3]|uniref:non-hydrolyzing UDP-N-acetylglucosamine 2-epimerase n=1 Tax=Actinopolymorpha sp. B9G3 TaxID=3158970 RepID=UPI0032D962A1